MKTRSAALLACAATALAIVLATSVPAGAIAPAPVFSAASGCGGASMIQVFPFESAATVSASDTVGETVTISVSPSTPSPATPWGPAWFSFSSTPGNPGTGTVQLNRVDLLGVLYALITQTPWNATFVATDSLVPVASSQCQKTIRVSLF